MSSRVEDFTLRIRTIFPQEELASTSSGRGLADTGIPTDDLRYLPEEALFVAHMKALLLGHRPATRD